MHIVLAVSGSRGDVHPMLDLGSDLRAAGHSVRVCTTPDFESEVRAAGLDFHPVGTSVRLLLQRNAEAIRRGPRETIRASLSESRQMLDDQFAALPDGVAGADLVLGAGVQLAGPSAAELHGVPYRFVAYCPILFPSREYPPFILTRQGMPGFLNRWAWRGARVFFRVALRPAMNRRRRALGLPPVGDIYEHVASPAPLLAVDAHLATVGADCPSAVTQLRCLHHFAAAPLPEKLEAFLDQGPPPVYLGFGSMPDPNAHETTQLLLSAIEHAGVRAVIGSGWAGLGSGPLPDGVFAAGSVSHPALFPRMACVVHHGGAGTTTTAARAGVPQVLVPHLLDQFYWAHRVWSLGVAPPALKRTHLDAETLGATIRGAIDSEWMAERASELGRSLRSELETPLDLERVLRTQ